MPRLALLLAFLLLALPAFAQTASDDPYTVTGIAVDAKGANGSEARDKAFTDGGRAALAALATKLTGVKDPSFKATDNNTIGRLIKSFEVESEKTSGARYIATLTYHFKPSMTDSFLTSRGMALKDPSELNDDHPAVAAASDDMAPAAPSQKIVVLPIIRTGDRSVLWEEHTDWARAWENYVSDHSITNVAVPPGEMEDINTIAAQEALSGLPGPLTKMMQNYEAQGVLVAVLSAPTINPTPEKDMNVQLSIYDSTASLRSTSSFNLAGNPQKKAMEWLQDGAGTAIAKWQTESKKAVASARKPATPDAVMTPNGLQMAINVPFTSPQQWQAMRSALQETNGVTRFDVVGLTHSKATALITFMGSRAQLDAALREKGLMLQQSGAGPVTLAYISQPQVIGVPARVIAPPPQTGSTFQTVYPRPPAPEPKDEIIYADPNRNKGDNGDTSSDDGDDSESVPPPKSTVPRKAPPAPEVPPIP